jgi:dihydrodipicolinate synthase/N-acetylneuraminate lyase
VKGVCLPAYGSEFYKLDEAEREKVIGICIEQVAKRTAVVAQANHGAALHAARLARTYEQMGADVISFAIPRQFQARDVDVLRYCGRIADAVNLPVLIQDFNPGGPTLDAPQVEAIVIHHPNVRYVKLEESLIVDKIERIRDRLGDRLGILEGWGGYYMLEAIAGGVPL